MIRTLATLSLSLVVAAGAHAQVLIAGWDFQTTSNGGTALSAVPDTPKVVNANFGSGALYLDGQFGSSDWVVAANSTTELNSLGGTTINTTGTEFSTITTGASALVLQNQAANSNSIIFRFSMAGLTGLSISLAAQRTSSGFSQQVWEWSTNGSLYNPIGSFLAGTGSGSLRDSFLGTGVLGFSGITGLNNAADARVRVTFGGASTTSGNNRIDNVQFSAVPEPSTYALFVLSAAGLAGHILRRRRR